jgi:hypothetical protein
MGKSAIAWDFWPDVVARAFLGKARMGSLFFALHFDRPGGRVCGFFVVLFQPLQNTPLDVSALSRNKSGLV